MINLGHDLFFFLFREHYVKNQSSFICVLSMLWPDLSYCPEFRVTQKLHDETAEIIFVVEIISGQILKTS